jgi:DNA-directed RNA polymerase sigma subunit (sigma70/sigma32)
MTGSTEIFEGQRAQAVAERNHISALRADAKLHGYRRLSEAELRQEYTVITTGVQAQTALQVRGQELAANGHGGWRLSGDGPGTPMSWSEDVQQLLDVAIAGKQAEGRIAGASLGLVQTIAWRFCDRGLSVEELVGFGNIGLLRGIPKHDPETGKKFSTVVGGWIMMEMTRALWGARGKGVHVPEHVRPLEELLWEIHSQFLRDHGREPSAEELVWPLTSAAIPLNEDRLKKGEGRLKITEPIVTGLLGHMFGRTTSLEKMGEEGEGSLENWGGLVDPASEEPFRQTVFNETLEATAVGARLTRQQELAVRIRLELLREGEEELDPVAGRLKVKRQRVPQLLGAAGKRIKKTQPWAEADLRSCAA